MRLAHDVIVDHDAHQIVIDGEMFPFHVSPDIEVEGAGADELASVTLRVFASNLRVKRDGLTQVKRQATPAEESRWAKQRGTDAVVAGLADVLKWIKRGVAQDDFTLKA